MTANKNYYYSEKNLIDVHAKHAQIEDKTNSLLLKYVGHEFQSVKAREYARHGFGRRIQTIWRCIDNVFQIVPPDTVDPPDRDRLHDAQINLQSFVANLYGGADNLAWVWVHENGLVKKLLPKQVGLRSAQHVGPKIIVERVSSLLERNGQMV